MRIPRNDVVICPECVHEFYAICVDDQKVRSAAEAHIHRLETALRQIVEKPGEDNEWDAVDKYRECQEIAAACFTKETPAEHPDKGTPNYCPICSPKNIGYCRCEVASNE